MTLRLRILVLFLCFGILPILMLAAGDYVQSMRALRTVLDVRAEGMAAEIARDMGQAATRAEAQLRTAAGRLDAADALGSAEAARAVVGGVVGPFEELRLLDGDRPAWILPLRTGAVRHCASDADTVYIRLPVPGTRGLELEGRASARAFLATVIDLDRTVGSNGRTQVLSTAGEDLLYDSRCEAGPAPPGTVSLTVLQRARQHVAPGERSVRYNWDAGTWHASADLLPGLGLAVVVHGSEDAFMAPFRESRVRYLGATLVILLLLSLLFLVAAQYEFRSLRTLTAAADQIEVGNLRPWLPPPGDDEVGRLSLAFRRMIERLSESIRQVELNQKLAAVGELASYLSHEIRNPLSSIRLSLQSLHRDLRSGFIPSDASRVIEIALGEVARLEGVVRTVLEVGRQGDKVGGRSCSVHEELERTLDVLRPRIRAHGIELEYVPRAGQDRVHADPDGLRSVWINLLVNAMDALEGVPDPRIRVSTWSGRGDTGELHVRVADNGPGVPPDVVDTIFEPFVTTKRGGNGIGLPTALRTVQPWGGTITYEPVAAGTGAVFVVRLRLQPESEGGAAPEPVADGPLPEAALPS